MNVGKTPLIDYPVQIGTRDVQVKSAAGDRRLSIAATVKPVVVEVDLSNRKLGFKVQGSGFKVRVDGAPMNREP